MTDARTKILLGDILDNARIAQQHIHGHTAESFAASITSLYAATRAVEIVGEAASQIDPAARSTMPGVPWRHAIAMRNRLIHGYRTVAAKVVFETIRDDFPLLITEIEQILKSAS